MKTITLRCYNGETRTMACDRAPVAPHMPDVEFVVHRGTLGGWAVSEITTGMRVPGSEGRTKRQALDLARERLLKIDIAKWDSVIAKAARFLRNEKHPARRAGNHVLIAAK